MTKGFWESVESARQIQAFTSGDWHMMIIPSFQGNLLPAYHVIVDREGENGLLVNCLMTKDEIEYAYGIQM